MLFLLRQIRRKLLNSNKVATYLLYGVGEIVLVVVGILIAVSIDDWNESRKNKKLIDNSIKFLVHQIQDDSIKAYNIYNYTQLEVDTLEAQFQTISSTETSIDTIIYIMQHKFRGLWIRHFDHNTTAYENMKSLGVFDMLGDSLKVDIDNYYKALDSNFEAIPGNVTTIS